MNKFSSIRLLAFFVLSLVFSGSVYAQASDPYAVWNREAPKPRWANFFTDSIPSNIGVYAWNIDQRLSEEDYWPMARDQIRRPFREEIEGYVFYSYDQINWYFFDDIGYIAYEEAAVAAYWAGQPPPPIFDPMIYMGALPEEACMPYGS